LEVVDSCWCGPYDKTFTHVTWSPICGSLKYVYRTLDSKLGYKDDVFEKLM